MSASYNILMIRDPAQRTLAFLVPAISSHWKARLMLAKKKTPSSARSVSFLVKCSLTMTLEMKEELLLVMLFLGFFFLPTSLVLTGWRAVLPSPKAGADPRVREVGGASLMEPPPPSLLRPASVE